MTKRHIEIGVYAIFIAAIMLAPLVMDPFWLNRIAKYLVFGMLGIAVALSWGYAGVLNLGQGLFFGGGAYMLAMSLKLASQTSLQQGSDKWVLANTVSGLKFATAAAPLTGDHPARMARFARYHGRRRWCSHALATRPSTTRSVALEARNAKSWTAGDTT